MCEIQRHAMFLVLVCVCMGTLSGQIVKEHIAVRLN